MCLSYQEWKKIKKQTEHSTASRYLLPLLNFEKAFPDTAASYERRLKAEKKKREQLMSIENPKEREKAIAQNLELFSYGKR